MKISIIMPTYQDAESIGQSIESVMSQTYDDWEMIIVNDGSTDETAEVVAAYLGRPGGEKIHYYEQENADQLNAIKTGFGMQQEILFIFYIPTICLLKRKRFPDLWPMKESIRVTTLIWEIKF